MSKYSVTFEIKLDSAFPDRINDIVLILMDTFRQHRDYVDETIDQIEVKALN